MVQIIPANPTFGTLLAQALGNVGLNLGEGLTKRFENKRIQSFLGNYLPGGAAADNSSPGTSANLNPSNNTVSQPQSNQITPQVLASAAADPALRPYLPVLQGQYEQQQKQIRDIQKEERADERTFREAELKPYFERIAKNKESLPDALQSNEQVIDAIQKGKVGPGSSAHLAKIAEDLGVPSSITKLLQSPDSKEFNNGIKRLYGNTIKDTFRGTTTQREIDIAEATEAEIGVSKEANLAAALATQARLLIKQEELRIHDELVEQGTPRAKIPALVEKKLMPYRKRLSKDYFDKVEQLRSKKR